MKVISERNIFPEGNYKNYSKEVLILQLENIKISKKFFSELTCRIITNINWINKLSGLDAEKELEICTALTHPYFVQLIDVISGCNALHMVILF